MTTSNHRSCLSTPTEITMFICHNCGIEVAPHKAFSVYDHKFCSTKCIEPLRQQEEIERKKREEEQDRNRSKHGAFSLSNCGSY